MAKNEFQLSTVVKKLKNDRIKVSAKVKNKQLRNLSINDAEKFLDLKDQIQKLYTKLHKLENRLVKKYGEGKVECRIKSKGEEHFGYTLNILDAEKDFREGKPVYRTTSVRRYSFILNPIYKE